MLSLYGKNFIRPNNTLEFSKTGDSHSLELVVIKNISEFMRLYFNGCSHTYGDDLTDPAATAWPSILSHTIGADFLNDSVSGGTNDRIVYKTIKNINQFDKFYIAWTYTSRFTRYRSDNNHDVNFNSHLVHSLYGKDPDFVKYGKIHYKIWHNELYATKLWLQNIVMLQRLFESENKSYTMVNSTHNHLDRWASSWQNFNTSVQSLLCFDQLSDIQLRQEHDEIQQLLSMINTDRFVGWNNWCFTNEIQHYPVGKTRHLLEQGHKAIALRILTHDSN